MDYTTLYQMRTYRGFKPNELTKDDATLQDFIRGASKWIDRYCRRHFDPRIQTRKLDYPLRRPDTFGQYTIDAEAFVSMMSAMGQLNDGRMSLDADLLKLQQVFNGDGTEIDLADLDLEPANSYPKHSLVLDPSTDLAWTRGTNGKTRQVICVTGIFGYHDDYDNAWVDSLDTVQNNPIGIADTGLEVLDAGGDAEDLLPMRFQAGQLLQIEDEMLLVRVVNTATNVVTVKRAENGSTAAEHAQDTPIYVFRPMEDVRRACVRLVNWMYTQKDSNSSDVQQILGSGVRVVPQAVPPDVIKLLPKPKPESLRDH